MKRYITYIVLAVSLFIFSSCSALFQGKVAMSPSNGTLGGLFEDPDKTIELTAPSQVFVSKAESSTQISLSWNAVPGATSYFIYRAVVPVTDAGTSVPPDEGEYMPLKRVYGITSYSDEIIDTEPTYKNVEYKNHYYYMVSAQNNDSEGPFSASVNGYLLSAPTGVVAETGVSTERIRITWNKVPGASRYKIYRSVNENGTSAEYLGSIGSNEQKFDNKMSSSEQGTEYYYQITSISSSGRESVKSPLAMGFSLLPGAPATPVITGISRGTFADRIKITFNGSAGGDVTYAIFRNSSEDSTLIKLGTPTGGVYEDVYSAANVQYFKPGVYYYYFVQAQKKDDETGQTLKSPFSESTNGTGKVINEGYMLSPTTDFYALSESDGLKFNWKPAIGSASEQQTYNYILYYSSAQNGTFSQLAMVTPETKDDGYLGWTLNDPLYKTGFFKLSTMNTSGVESVMSEVVEPSPSEAKNVSASKELVQSNFAPNANGVYPVKITWEAPEDGAAVYHVYRSTSATSGFRKITDAPITGLFYVDTNDTAKAGAYYYYRVLSLNSLGQGAVYSDTAYGYGALSQEQFYREYVKTLNSSQKKLTLMHKSNDMDKLGSENASGNLGGTLSYNAKVDGMGARIVMHYSNYADLAAPDGNRYMVFEGDTNTSANMSANGQMDGTVTVTGMYRGTVNYNNIQIKGGDAGGGHYVVTSSSLPAQNVAWNIK